MLMWRGWGRWGDRVMGGEPVQVKGTNEKLRPHSCPLKDSELAGIEVAALKRRPQTVFGKLHK